MRKPQKVKESESETQQNRTGNAGYNKEAEQTK
jgi:hypothetical protein